MSSIFDISSLSSEEDDSSKELESINDRDKLQSDWDKICRDGQRVQSDFRKTYERMRHGFK
jgi:hypothetical protein